MLQLVDVTPQPIDAYIPIVGADVIQELRQLAQPLRGLRIAQINSTAYGGGVSELLHSIIPLERDLGIQSEWRVITGDERFFQVTKSLHNALQGAKFVPTAEFRETYLSYSERNAKLLGADYDIVLVHDPQPAGMRVMCGDIGHSRWVWRCHIDTSQPDHDAWSFFRPFLTSYDAAIFTMREFIPPDFPIPRVAIIPPGIDPLSPKNIDIPNDLARRFLNWLGLQPDQPLIAQIARFDPWKDPLGVIAAYRLVRQRIPNLQLALVAGMAGDDPEAWELYRRIIEEKGNDDLIHVHTTMTGTGNFEINALQRMAHVIVQKSIREGFGLVVSEALWKGTPVVAGKAGGIPSQAPPGIGGFLVSSIEETAERVQYLLQHPTEARDLGQRGHAHVLEHFLITRYLADQLRLLGSLTQARP